jgi:hypothetical protein
MRQSFTDTLISKPGLGNEDKTEAMRAQWRFII